MAGFTVTAAVNWFWHIVTIFILENQNYKRVMIVNSLLQYPLQHYCHCPMDLVQISNRWTPEQTYKQTNKTSWKFWLLAQSFCNITCHSLRKCWEIASVVFQNLKPIAPENSSTYRKRFAPSFFEKCSTFGFKRNERKTPRAKDTPSRHKITTSADWYGHIVHAQKAASGLVQK